MPIVRKKFCNEKARKSRKKHQTSKCKNAHEMQKIAKKKIMKKTMN
jgi:hypothetical protein